MEPPGAAASASETEPEVAQMRACLRRVRYFLFALLAVTCAVALHPAYRDTNAAYVAGTALAVVATLVMVSLHVDDTSSVQEMQVRLETMEVASALGRTALHLAVLLCQDSLPQMFKLVVVFLFPLASATQASQPAGVLAYLSGHFLLVVLQVRGNFWTEGWQWLMTLAFCYCILAEIVLNRDTNKADSNDSCAASFKAVRALLSMVCDGYLFMDDTGNIRGMDQKAECLLEVSGTAGSDAVHSFLSFVDTAASPSAGQSVFSIGLRTLCIRTSSGQRVEVEAYTVPCFWTPGLREGLPLLLGQPLARMPLASTGKYYLRALRILQHFEDNPRDGAGRGGSGGAEGPNMAAPRTRSAGSSAGSKSGGGARTSGGTPNIGLQMHGGNLGDFSSVKCLGPREKSPMHVGVGAPPRSPKHQRDAMAKSAMWSDSPLSPPTGGKASPAPGPSAVPAFTPPTQASLQKLDAGEDSGDIAVAAAAALEAIGAGTGPQAFPAGPWRSMQAVGLGVGEYTKVRTIAKGSQGMVVEVESRTGERLAMKEVPLPGMIWQRDFPKLLQGADREVRALKGLAWASGVVVKLVDCWISADFKQANIVMELLPHTLRDILDGRRRQNQGPPPVEQSARWFTQTTVGLAAIHCSGYIHRDIKPSNLLLTEDLRHCKIADLGVSRPLCNNAAKPHAPAPSTFDENTSDVSCMENNFDAGSRAGTDITEASRATGATEATSILSGYTQRPGTKAYTSPEALVGKHYDIKLDVFSLGCVLLELLAMISVPSMKLGEASGKKLVETVEEALRKQQDEAGAEGGGGSMSDTFLQLKDIGLRMLDPTPDLRPTPQDVMNYNALKPYLQALLQEHPELSKTLHSDRGGGAGMRSTGLSLFNHGR